MTVAPESTVLPARPSLIREYARSLLTAGRRRLTKAVPDNRLRLPGVRVDRDNLTSYQQLCGFAVNDRLPMTYPHLLGFPLQVKLMTAPEFPLPLPGLVHLHRGPATEAPADAAVPPGVPNNAPVAQWRLPADLGRRYAAVSGDVNPIHLYPWTARVLGFRRAIAHGMWSCARTLAALGPRTTAAGRCSVWFRKPVLLPGTVALRRAERSDGSQVAALVGRGDVVHLVLMLS